MKEMDSILAEIKKVLALEDPQQLMQAVELLATERRIFVLGEGRSGLQGKGFAMRLMHLGRTVFVIGESTTPAIRPDDILVAISGSGKTGTVLALAEKAAKKGTTVLGITSDSNSPLAKLADQLLVIPGATKTGAGVKSIQLLSTLFDQTLHITLDYLCLKISQKTAITNEQANQQHSNME